MINHLSGKMSEYIKLSFRTVQDLSQVKNQLKPKIERNKLKSTVLCWILLF